MRTALWFFLFIFFKVSYAYCDGIIIEKPPSPLYFCTGDSYRFNFKFKDTGNPLYINWKKLGDDGNWQPVTVSTVDSFTINDTISKTFSLNALAPNIKGRYWIFVDNQDSKENYDFEVKVIQSPVIQSVTPVSPMINCENGSVNLQPSLSETTSNSKYAWWLNNNNVSTSKNYLANNPGNYIFIVSNIESTKICSDTSFIKVMYDGTGSPKGKIKPESPKITCNGTSVELEAYDFSNVTSYTWTRPNGTPQTNSLKITADKHGIYKLKLSNGNVACDTTLTISVGIDTLRPSLNFNNVQDYICENQETSKIIFQSSPLQDYSFAWSNGASTSKIDIKAAGNYSVTITNLSNGCISSKSWFIQKKNPYFIKEIQIDTTIVDSSAFIFNVPPMAPPNFSPTMNWEVSKMSNLQLLSGDNKGTGKINIKLSLLDINSLGIASIIIQPVISDCDGKIDTIRIRIYPNGGIYVPEIITPNGDGYNDDWEIGWPSGSSEHHVVLFNRLGGKMFEWSNQDNNFQEIERLNDGIYFYILEYQIGNEIKRMGGSVLVLHGEN